MAFMVPEYKKGKFAVGEMAGESIVVPVEYKDDVLWDDEPSIEDGWFCRLSAPGFLDCTDWTGSFRGKQDAMDYIEETFEVDPETGDDLAEEEDAA